MSDTRSLICQLPTLRIVLPAHQRERLKTTCFRGNGQALAGNFYRWHTDEQFLQNKFILKELEDDALEALASDAPYTTWSCEIDCSNYIGWASTTRLENIDEEAEEFSPNRWTRAWKIKDRNALAPPTKTLTIVYSLESPRVQSETPALIIQSIYPGQDVPLGSRSAPRTIDWSEMVFLDWNNPGSTVKLLAEAVTVLSRDAFE